MEIMSTSNIVRQFVQAKFIFILSRYYVVVYAVTRYVQLIYMLIKITDNLQETGDMIMYMTFMIPD